MNFWMKHFAPSCAHCHANDSSVLCNIIVALRRERKDEEDVGENQSNPKATGGAIVPCLTSVHFTDVEQTAQIVPQRRELNLIQDNPHLQTKFHLDVIPFRYWSTAILLNAQTN